MKIKFQTLLFALFVFASCDSNESKKRPSENFEYILEKSFLRKDTQTWLPSLEKLVNKETGIYVIYKPGAIPTIKKYKSVAEINDEHTSIGYALMNVNCQMQKGNFPKFDFNKEAFSSSGCFHKDISGVKIISETQAEVAEMLGGGFTKKERKAASEIDKTISKILLISDASLELYFAFSNGKYYLVLIDAAKYDLST